MVAQEEIFGPVLVAMTFRTPREAVELANNTVLWPCRERVEREHQCRAPCGRANEGGRGVGELHEYVRCGMRIRRLSRERLWTRGRHTKE